MNRILLILFAIFSGTQSHAGLSRVVLIEGKVDSFSREFVSIETPLGKQCKIPTRFVLSKGAIVAGNKILAAAPARIARVCEFKKRESKQSQATISR